MNNPDKKEAHRLTAIALRAGRIARRTRCEQCGRAGDIEMHHPDYSKPLLVQWLCTKCHGKTRRLDECDVIP